MTCLVKLYLQNKLYIYIDDNTIIRGKNVADLEQDKVQKRLNANYSFIMNQKVEPCLHYASMKQDLTTVVCELSRG